MNLESEAHKANEMKAEVIAERKQGARQQEVAWMAKCNKKT